MDARTTNAYAQDIANRIIIQRMSRFTDTGPSLSPAGAARFRFEPSRLRLAYATANAGCASDLVERVLRFAALRRLSVQWNVLPTRPGEEELAAALSSAGFERVEHLLLMAHQGPITGTPSPHITINPISIWPAMWNYEYGSRICFYGDARPSDALVNQRATERWHEQERGWTRYYSAALDGGATVVGGCYVSLYEDIPTIMGVYTLPQARQQGVATALLTHAVASVISEAAPYTCLYVEHGNPAERLYRSLGFFPLLDADMYVWSPGR